MPGFKRLVRMLGINSRAAADRGFRRQRPPSLRLQILLHGEEDSQVNFMVDLLHWLIETGHRAEFASRCLEELGMDLRRVVRRADSIARGRDDLRKTYTRAIFVEGGTIGTVPKGR